MQKIKIIIADDHDLFRRGLVELLRKQDNFNIIADVADGKALMESLGHELADIILLDLTMPIMNGFEVLDRIAKLHPSIRAIVISMHDDGNYIAKCARYGAFGYLLKNAEEEELVEAINQVSKGKKHYATEVTEKMINTMSAQLEDQKELSKKEIEILQLLTKGLTTKEIAAQLFVSTRTVETHRANMLRKLDVKNTAELIGKAASLRLI